ncbi:hypothetical protein ABVK25_011467 [Lepraria finkii]|uniref:Uncharacterized protein n=1 Tax=Lepraria finkii TaxID=1340010 RepID=A0ABR4AVG6_9LECA
MSSSQLGTLLQYDLASPRKCCLQSLVNTISTAAPQCTPSSPGSTDVGWREYIDISAYPTCGVSAAKLVIGEWGRAETLVILIDRKGQRDIIGFGLHLWPLALFIAVLGFL